jgi:hypothetical protein
MMRQEAFDTPLGWVSRGEALRAFVAAIYDTAKVKSEFTTDDVFPRVRSFVPAEVLRRATATSKLIGAALSKARAKGIVTRTNLEQAGDDKCHRRVKRVWRSNIYMQ